MGKIFLLILVLGLCCESLQVWAAEVSPSPTASATVVSLVLSSTVSPVSSSVPVTPTRTPYCQPTVVTAAPYTGPVMEMTPVYYVIHTPQDWSNYNSEVPIGAVDLAAQMLVIFPDQVQPGFKPRSVEIRSACVLSDHIQIDYFYVGDPVPVETPVVTSLRHHHNRGSRAHSVAVILPQSNLPIVTTIR